jgi:hypothetical protein
MLGRIEKLNIMLLFRTIINSLGIIVLLINRSVPSTIRNHKRSDKPLVADMHQFMDSYFA